MTPAELHDAYRRDLRSLREDLVAAQEATSRQVLVAHMRALKLLEDAEGRAQTFRAEVRADLAELRADQRTILSLLERTVEIPAAPGRLGRLVERVGAVLALRPASARMLVACALVATFSGGLGSLLSACTVAGAMRARSPVALDAADPGGSR